MEVFSNKNVFSAEAVQPIMDAAALLQVQRSQLAKALAAGERLAGARLVAHGLDEINEWLRDGLSTWRELHSVRLTTTVETLRVSLPRNRYFVSRGARMVSFFDYFRTDPMARLLLSAEQEGEYYFCYAPVQMKILERRTVLLEGPPSEGQPTLMAVTHPGCLAAANAYWRALEASAFPCTKAGSDVEELSPRQRRIISLLAADCSDEQIAKTVGVSVRTVRYDIAHLLERLDARSRFAAGIRIGELRTASVAPPPSPSEPGGRYDPDEWPDATAPETADERQPPASPRIGSGFH